MEISEVISSNFNSIPIFISAPQLYKQNVLVAGELRIMMILLLTFRQAYFDIICTLWAKVHFFKILLQQICQNKLYFDEFKFWQAEFATKYNRIAHFSMVGILSVDAVYSKLSKLVHACRSYSCWLVFWDTVYMYVQHTVRYTSKFTIGPSLIKMLACRRSTIVQKGDWQLHILPRSALPPHPRVFILHKPTS